MNLIISKYKKLFDSLPTTTKSIILLALLGLTYIVWYNSFWTNLRQPSQKTSNQIKTLQQSVPRLKKQASMLEKELSDKQKVIYDQSSLSNKMLSPQETKTVLHNLLKKNNSLVLLNFNNLPPKEVLLPKAKIKVYEHGMVIKFLGDYFSAMNYLKEIEKLSWKIFWDMLEYKVTKYPAAEITLHIHTINTNDEWIHV